jgi:hypothetical protein
MRLSISVLLLSMISACGGGQEPSPAPTPDVAPGAASLDKETAPAEAVDEAAEDVLVTVGDAVVTVGEFKSAAARKMPASGESLSLEEKKEVLDKLVSDRLLYLNGLSLGVDKDPKVQKVVVNTLLRDIVYADVRNDDFPEADLRAYYETNRADFVIQAKVQLRRILVLEKEEGDAKAEAQRLHGEVTENPARFRELAAKFSEGDFKRRGGDMGFIPRSGKPGVDMALVDKAFTMETDQISAVFKTDEGWNILMVAKKRERHERSFQQVRGAVLRKLKNDRMTTLLDNYVANLKTAMTVSIDESKLDGLKIENVRRPGGRQGLSPVLAQPGSPGALPPMAPGIGSK